MDTYMMERRVGIAAQFLLRELSPFLSGDAIRRRISESYLGDFGLTPDELALATVHALNMLAVGVFAARPDEDGGGRAASEGKVIVLKGGAQA